MACFSMSVAVLICSQSTMPTDVFDYDAEAPLEIVEHTVDVVEGGVRIIDTSYASPKGGRVPAYLVTPPGTGSFAAVVFMHEGGADRTEFLSEAVALARSGALSIMIDAPYRRTEPPPVPENAMRGRAESDRDLYVGLVVDLRRAVDLLAARPEVDAARIGYVGHSLGSTWGGVLAGLEPRIKTFVLMAGVPNPGKVSGQDPYSKLMQTVLGTEPAELEHYDALVGAIAAQHFVGVAPAGSILFQLARYDRQVSPERAEAFPATAGPSHEVRWYLTGHRFLDERAAADRREWLGRRLELQER